MSDLGKKNYQYNCFCSFFPQKRCEISVKANFVFNNSMKKIKLRTTADKISLIVLVSNNLQENKSWKKEN